MDPITRRTFVKTTAAGAAALAATRLIGANPLASARPDAPGYFEREFGITDELCRQVLVQALAKGGDFADLYFEHTVSNWVQLEDGKVNRAYGDVALGVGIRTVKGDQVGYGFTQELTKPAMLAAAAIAATIADANATARPAVSPRPPSRTIIRCPTCFRPCRSRPRCRWSRPSTTDASPSRP